jgi:type VI secretion system protein VasG
MADISLEAVTGKLNRIGYETFIQALRQAKSAGNRNLELAHWIAHLLQNDRSDIALTADYFKLDRARLAADIAAVVNGFRKNETEIAAGTTGHCTSAKRKSVAAICWSAR